MKRVSLYQIVWLVIILAFMHSCTSKNQEVVRDENGNIFLKCELKKGVRYGKCYQYYPNGNIWVISRWVAGFQDGETIEYFETGKIKRKSIFTKGQPIEHELYDDAGRLMKKAFYIIINRQSKLNGLMVFDTNNADKFPDNINFKETTFAQIFADKDTIDYGGFAEYEVEWICSTEHYAGAFVGNFDHNFNMVDTSSMKEVDLENKNRFYPANLGTDTLRIIFDFMKIEDGKERVFTTRLEKVFTVIEK